jgi:hypothetical protein
MWVITFVPGTNRQFEIGHVRFAWDSSDVNLSRYCQGGIDLVNLSAALPRNDGTH